MASGQNGMGGSATSQTGAPNANLQNLFMQNAPTNMAGGGTQLPQITAPARPAMPTMPVPAQMPQAPQQSGGGFYRDADGYLRPVMTGPMQRGGAGSMGTFSTGLKMEGPEWVTKANQETFHRLNKNNRIGGSR